MSMYKGSAEVKRIIQNKNNFAPTYDSPAIHGIGQS